MVAKYLEVVMLCQVLSMQLSLVCLLMSIVRNTSTWCAHCGCGRVVVVVARPAARRRHQPRRGPATGAAVAVRGGGAGGRAPAARAGLAASAARGGLEGAGALRAAARVAHLARRRVLRPQQPLSSAKPGTGCSESSAAP